MGKSVGAFLVLAALLSPAPQAPENWPGYEGRLHQSSSSVDIAPGSLGVAWTRQFNILVPVNEGRIWGDPGTMHSRNLVCLNGRLALAATVDAGSIRRRGPISGSRSSPSTSRRRPLPPSRRRP